MTWKLFRLSLCLIVMLALLGAGVYGLRCEMPEHRYGVIELPNGRGPGAWPRVPANPFDELRTWLYLDYWNHHPQR